MTMSNLTSPSISLKPKIYAATICLFKGRRLCNPPSTNSFTSSVKYTVTLKENTLDIDIEWRVRDLVKAFVKRIFKRK